MDVSASGYTHYTTRVMRWQWANNKKAVPNKTPDFQNKFASPDVQKKRCRQPRQTPDAATFSHNPGTRVHRHPAKRRLRGKTSANLT